MSACPDDIYIYTRGLVLYLTCGVVDIYQSTLVKCLHTWAGITIQQTSSSTQPTRTHTHIPIHSEHQPHLLCIDCSLQTSSPQIIGSHSRSPASSNRSKTKNIEESCTQPSSTNFGVWVQEKRIQAYFGAENNSWIRIFNAAWTTNYTTSGR